MTLRLQSIHNTADFITCHMLTVSQVSTTEWDFYFDNFCSNEVHDVPTLLSVFFRVLTYYMARTLGPVCPEKKAFFQLFTDHGDPSQSDLLVTSGLLFEADRLDSWDQYTMSFPLAKGNFWFTSLPPLLDNMNESIIFSSIESRAPIRVSGCNHLSYFCNSTSMSGKSSISSSCL